MTDPAPAAPQPPGAAPAASPPPPAKAPAAAPAASADPAAAKRPTRVSELRFGSYPLFALFWPLIVVGEICAALLHWKEAWQVPLTWVYLTTLLTCMVAVGFDVRRNLAIGWLLFVALLWVGGLYLRDALDVPLLGHLLDFFTGMDARVGRGFMHAMSVLVAIGMIGVFMNVFINHRWRITPNELHLVRRGEMEDAITRGAKRLSVEYPDVFEMLLLGAGHIVVRDSRGKEEIRRIPRVPFLLFREKQLDQIAEAWAVVHADGAAVEDDEG
ncbi:MAG: hypothetical protein FJ293_09835 [Planctomycetes bacterium]|nr:hypothetical protein [Planctomycetota bacterium]